MTLDDLTSEEERLTAEVRRAQGTIEQKIAHLEKLGIFTAYQKVHEQYARLAIDGNAEALKRAFFLQWYASIEPAFLTGIPDGSPLGTARGLDHENQLQVLAEVERCHAAADAELRWMLAYAYALVDYYFDFWPGLDALKAYLSGVDTTVLWLDLGAAEQMKGRGQMGEYYISVIESAKAHGAV